MLTLTGRDALVFHVAKGGLRNLPDPVVRLRVAIAVWAGLASSDHVRIGDLLSIVSDVVDRLVGAGCLERPLRDLVSYITMMEFADERLKVREHTSRAELVLGGMMSALQNSRIRTDSGEQLIEWQSALPADFEAQAQLFAGGQPAPVTA